MRIKKILLSLGLVAVGAAQAFAPTNFFPPYDPALRLPSMSKKDPLRMGVNIEWGESKSGYDWNRKKANVLALYSDTQSTLAMIEIPTDEVDNANLQLISNNLRLAGGAPRAGAAAGFGAFDDGIRGHLRFTGEFDGWDVSPHVRYVLPFEVVPGILAISAHLPFRWARIDDITIEDMTGTNLAAGATLPAFDLVVKELLTSDIKTFVKTYGQDLDLGAWDATDLGDFVIMLDWLHSYPQDKESLKNVDIHAKLGLRCPTGLEKDENKAFSMAFGNDGAWSIPFGLGLDLDFKSHIRFGAEADFEVIFDDTKERRMKTHASQTSFLMLNKGRATKDHGLLWKFYLYLQGYRFYKGLSFKTAYEYVKKDSDSLSPKSDNFNSGIVNGARWLDEWNSHQIIFSLNYDFLKGFKWAKPQLSLFYKLPIAGRSVVSPDTIGGQLAFSF